MDEDFFYGQGVAALAPCLIEEEPREVSWTGLFDADGNRILRVPVPKPKFGFPIYPEDNDGYGFNTDEDYFYGSQG